MSGTVPLVIDEAVRAKMRAVVALAEGRPIPLEVLQVLARGEPPPSDLNADFTFDIPMGFTVTYTHEAQEKGLLRHLSMSVHRKGRVPHPVAVQMVMEEMGFIHKLEDCITWPEAVGGGVEAINVVEPLDGDWAPFGRGVPAR